MTIRTEAAQSSLCLVVGASRGIGLALVENQLAEPAVRRVIATVRPASDRRDLDRLAKVHGERLHTVELDVTDDSSLVSFGHYLDGMDGDIDSTIHAAGILHDSTLRPEKSLADCSAANLLRSFEVNSIGPLMVARCLLARQARRRHFSFAVLSAMVGSITDNRLGGWYGYRASKAALNQLIRTLAIECRVKHPGACILASHPGTTDTALSRPFQRNVRPDKLYTPTQTATRILKVVQQAGPEQSGSFLNWDGTEIPW